MPASVRSPASAASSGGNVTVTKPAGTADGDLLLAVCFADPDGSAVSAPAGWTQVGVTYSPASRGFGSVFRKAASGEGASYVFPGNAGSSNAVMMLAVTGHDAASPIDVAATWTDGGSIVGHIAPSVSPTGSDSLLVCGWYGLCSGTVNSYTTAAGMSEWADLQPGGNWIATSLATLALTSSGATGTKVATLTSARPYIGVSVAVKSAATGGSTVVPDGIAAPVALGAPTVAWSGSVAPDGVAAPVAVGPPTAVAQSIANPDGIAIPVALGSPTLTWSGSIGPDGLSVPVAIGAPIVGTASVDPDGIAVPVALGSPTLTWSATVAPDGVSVPVALGAPIVGAASVNPDGVTVPVTLGDPSLSWTGSVSPDGISVPVALGSPIIGAAPLAADGISVPVSLGAPSLAWSGAVSPDGITVPVAIGAPSLTIPGAVITRPDTGTTGRPATGTITRPDTGVVVHILTVVVRLYTGTVSRP